MHSHTLSATDWYVYADRSKLPGQKPPHTHLLFLRQCVKDCGTTSLDLPCKCGWVGEGCHGTILQTMCTRIQLLFSLQFASGALSWAETARHLQNGGAYCDPVSTEWGGWILNMLFMQSSAHTNGIVKFTSKQCTEGLGGKQLLCIYTMGICIYCASLHGQ